MNAALVVKISDTEWEVIAKYDLIEQKNTIFLDAIESGKTINGMIITPFRESATLGAVWNGSSFSGGKEPGYTRSEEDWEVTSTYALLADNVIFMTFSATLNDIQHAKMEAAFASDVTMVPIRLTDVVRLGSIWNGQEFTEAE